MVDSPRVSSPDGCVVAAVRAVLATAPSRRRTSRPNGGGARLTEILDAPRHLATQPAAARNLVAIPDTLSKRAQRRGKLASSRRRRGSEPARAKAQSPSIRGLAPSTIRRVARVKKITAHSGAIGFGI